MERKLLTLFIFIFFLNFWFLSVFGSGCDLAAFVSWGERLLVQPLAGFYHRNPDVNYPPLCLFILRVVAWFWSKINGLTPLFSQELVFKLPHVLADFFSGLAIFAVLKKEKSKLAIFSLPLYWFNAAVFNNSVFWGQFESLVALFLILTFLALEKKKPLGAGIALGLSCLTKPPNLVYLPFWFLGAWFSFSRRQLLFFSISFILSFLVPFFPFFEGQVAQFPSFVLGRFVYLFEGQPGVSHGAPNFWGLTAHFRAGSDQLTGPGGLTLQIWGGLLLLVFLGVGWLIFFLILKNKKAGVGMKSLLFALVALAIYLFPTRVHERHLFSLLPFLLTTSLLDSFFFPFYLLYSFSSVLTIGFTLYSPQRGFNLWSNQEAVIWLSAVNFLGLVGLVFFGLRRVFLPRLYNKGNGKQKKRK